MKKLWLVLLLLPALGMAQDFSVRLGTACEGSSTPKCGGQLGLVIGSGNTRSVSSVTTRYLGDGRLSQSYGSGVELVLRRTKYGNLFAGGQAEIVIAGDNRSGAGNGTLGLEIPVHNRPSFGLAVVLTGTGRNAPAESGDWDGGFTASLQVNFRE
jgi:hypothetical protein